MRAFLSNHSWAIRNSESALLAFREAQTIRRMVRGAMGRTAGHWYSLEEDDRKHLAKGTGRAEVRLMLRRLRGE